ncbi:hypothetical protein [Streptomyces sp. NPDC047123]|uniref:hypothetical protein n=1 Tax=Streptomyces sp. NPDC047123 TaxID=3155622 RepID=UPI0033F53B28
MQRSGDIGERAQLLGAYWLDMSHRTHSECCVCERLPGRDMASNVSAVAFPWGRTVMLALAAVSIVAATVLVSQ